MPQDDSLPDTRRLRGHTPVLYLTSWFTLKSTFIVRELNEVARTGADFCVYSLRRLEREEKRAVQTLPYPVREVITTDVRQIVRTALLALRNVRSLLGAVGVVYRENYRQPRVLAKALYAIWLACSIASDLRSRGLHVRHIHSHWATIPTTTAWILSRVLGVRFSFTAHAWDVVLENQMLPFKIASAAAVLTCTRYNTGVLGRLAPDHLNKIHVVYHGLPLGQFTYRPRRPDIDVARILALGRYVEKKGFGFLLEAVRQLREAGTRVTCQFFGESGPVRADLVRFVARHGLADVVQLNGFISEEAVLAQLNAADVFVMPSVVEPNGAVDGIPNVIIEALAVGVPTVATAVAGIPEIIRNGETGLLVPPGDPVALKVAIQSLLQNPALRERVSTAGRQLVERNFDVVANSAEHWTLIEQSARIADPALASLALDLPTIHTT